MQENRIYIPMRKAGSIRYYMSPNGRNDKETSKEQEKLFMFKRSGRAKMSVRHAPVDFISRMVSGCACNDNRGYSQRQQKQD